MTVDDVASRAHVGKATVYRRWSRKEDLAVAAMEQLYDSEMPLPDTGSLRGDLLESFEQALTFVSSVAGAAYFRTSIAESIRDPRIARLYRDASETSERRALVLFERAIERGEARPDAHLAAAVQWLTGLLVLRAITGRAMPAVDEVEGLVDLVLRGVQAGPDQA